MNKSPDNNVLKVSDDVSWIGVLDYNIATFDIVMETRFGTTYNSWFVDASKKAIIETTKVGFWDEYIAKIKSVTDPSEIEYIIFNHTEPDHSGNLENLLELAPKAVVVGSGNAIRYLKDLMHPDFEHIIVKDGDEIDLGNKTLRFISAPNLHWPDTMYTYIPEDKLLFTCDSFGSHFCREEMFDDLCGNFDEAFHYYFDVILKPFSKFMLKAIDKIRDLDITAICPGHGPILRTKWKEYVDLSEAKAKEFLSLPEIPRVFIPYVSAYHKTGMIADKIAEGIRSAGNIEVDISDIEMMSFGSMEESLSGSAGLIVGSPTINQNVLLPIYKLFAAVSPLRDKNKLAGGFGSYGWSGEGSMIIKSALQNLKLNYMDDGAFFKFTPTEEDLKESFDYGRRFGEIILQNNK